MTNRLLTPQEVAARINVSKSTLYFWNHSKQHLRPLKIGGSLRYRQSDVDNFIEDGKVKEDNAINNR